MQIWYYRKPASMFVVSASNLHVDKCQFISQLWSDPAGIRMTSHFSFRVWTLATHRGNQPAFRIRPQLLGRKSQPFLGRQFLQRRAWPPCRSSRRPPLLPATPPPSRRNRSNKKKSPCDVIYKSDQTNTHNISLIIVLDLSASLNSHRCFTTSADLRFLCVHLKQNIIK